MTEASRFWMIFPARQLLSVNRRRRISSQFTWKPKKHDAWRGRMYLLKMFKAYNKITCYMTPWYAFSREYLYLEKLTVGISLLWIGGALTMAWLRKKDEWSSLLILFNDLGKMQHKSLYLKTLVANTSAFLTRGCTERIMRSLYRTWFTAETSFAQLRLKVISGEELAGYWE